MGLCMLSATIQRQKVADFSDWHSYDELCVISHIPATKKMDLIVVRAIDKHLWIALSLSLALVTILILFVQLRMAAHNRASLMEIVFTLFQILLNKCKWLTSHVCLS